MVGTNGWESTFQELQRAMCARDAREVVSIAAVLLNSDLLPRKIRVRTLIDRGWALGTLGEIARAETDLREAISRIDVDNALSDELGEAWIELGTVLRYGGKWVEARQAYDDAADVAHDGGRLDREISACILRASVDNLESNYWEAGAVLLCQLPRIAKLADTPVRHKVYGDCYRELTTYAYSTGQYSRALEYARKAEVEYANAQARVGRANALKDQGIVLGLMLDSPRAKEAFVESGEAFLRSNRTLGVAHSLRRMAEATMTEKDRLPDARSLLVAAVALYETQDPADPDGLCSSLILLAQVHERQGQHEAALGWLRRAIAVSKRASSDMEAYARFRLVMLETDGSGRCLRSQRLLEIASEVKAVSDPRIVGEFCASLGQALIDDNRVDYGLTYLLNAVLARETIRRGLYDATSRRRSEDWASWLFSEALDAAFMAGRANDALYVMEAGRAETVAALMESVNVIDDPSLRNRLAAISRAKTSRLEGEMEDWSSPESKRDVEIEYDLTEDEYAVIVRSLAGNPPDTEKTVGDLYQHLPVGAVWLSVDVGVELRTVYLAWGGAGISTTLVRRRLSPGVAELLQNVLNDAHSLGGVRRSLWRELSTVMFPDGLCGLVQAKKVSRIYISVQGRLAGLPWLALNVGRRRLIEVCTVSLVPSLAILATLLHLDRGAAKKHGIYYCIDRRLRGADREARFLAALPAASELTGSELRARLSSGDFGGMLVVSAHGSKEPGPQQSIRLSDDIEVTASMLARSRLPATVVLGACWSGVIDAYAGRDSFGLAVAALSGGATTVIGGLRAIDSRSAGIVLQRFYAHVSGGSGPADALRAAQTGRGWLRSRRLATVLRRTEIVAIGL